MALLTTQIRQCDICGKPKRGTEEMVIVENITYLTFGQLLLTGEPEPPKTEKETTAVDMCPRCLRRYRKFRQRGLTPPKGKTL